MDEQDIDVERMLQAASQVDRRELAELLSGIVKDMLDEGAPEEEVLGAYSSVCRRLGIAVGQLRLRMH